MTLVNVMICRKWSIAQVYTVWLCDFNEQPN